MTLVVTLSVVGFACSFLALVLLYRKSVSGFTYNELGGTPSRKEKGRQVLMFGLTAIGTVIGTVVNIISSR